MIRGPALEPAWVAAALAAAYVAALARLFTRRPAERRWQWIAFGVPLVAGAAIYLACALALDDEGRLGPALHHARDAAFLPLILGSPVGAFRLLFAMDYGFSGDVDVSIDVALVALLGAAGNALVLFIAAANAPLA